MRLLVCGFGPFPNFSANPAALVVERLRGAGWAPAGVDLAFELIPTTWGGAVEAAAEAAKAHGAAAVLLLGVAGSAPCFRVELRACNLAGAAADAEGRLHVAERILAEGPEDIAATAPTRAMVEAIAAEGLPVEASLSAGDYLCNYTFYRMLTDAPGGARIGFLHLPPVREAPPEDQPDFAPLDLDALERGVKAAVAAFARALAPDPPAARQ